MRVQSRYPEWLRATRCYGHLELALHAGRGHIPGGISETAPGEFVVECPACPHPGRNLRLGWENDSP